MKLILITLVAVVVGLMVACSSASRTSMFIPTTTPPGPAYSEEEAIAVLQAHLQAKPFPIPSGAPPGVTCFTQIDSDLVTWDAIYDDNGRIWNITATRAADGGSWAESLFKTPGPPASPAQWEEKHYTWSVYERTKSILATGDGWLNQVC